MANPVITKKMREWFKENGFEFRIKVKNWTTADGDGKLIYNRRSIEIWRPINPECIIVFDLGFPGFTDEEIIEETEYITKKYE